MFTNNTGEAAEYCLVYDAFQKLVFYAEVCLRASVSWTGRMNDHEAKQLILCALHFCHDVWVECCSLATVQSFLASNIHRCKTQLGVSSEQA